MKRARARRRRNGFGNSVARFREHRRTKANSDETRDENRKRYSARKRMYLTNAGVDTVGRDPRLARSHRDFG